MLSFYHAPRYVTPLEPKKSFTLLAKAAEPLDMVSLSGVGEVLASTSWLTRAFTRRPRPDLIREMSIGHNHAGFLSQTNDLFLIGSNEFGQCGRPDVLEEQLLGYHAANASTNPEQSSKPKDHTNKFIGDRVDDAMKLREIAIDNVFVVRDLNDAIYYDRDEKTAEFLYTPVMRNVAKVACGARHTAIQEATEMRR